MMDIERQNIIDEIVERREIQEKIKQSLPTACQGCKYIDGLGICNIGGCGCETE